MLSLFHKIIELFNHMYLVNVKHLISLNLKAQMEYNQKYYLHSSNSTILPW